MGWSNDFSVLGMSRVDEVFVGICNFVRF